MRNVGSEIRNEEESFSLTFPGWYRRDCCSWQDNPTRFLCSIWRIGTSRNEYKYSELQQTQIKDYNKYQFCHLGRYLYFVIANTSREIVNLKEICRDSVMTSFTSLDRFMLGLVTIFLTLLLFGGRLGFGFFSCGGGIPQFVEILDFYFYFLNLCLPVLGC